MNDRISTGMMFSQSVSLMLGKQSKINHLEQQIATGSKIVSAKDDPVAAGTAVGLDRVVAGLEQLGKNANNAQNRLGLQENALAQANELMTRAVELTIQANTPVPGNTDLKAIVSELKTIQDSLLSLANSKDGSGRYLFGGSNDSDAPFLKAGGVVSYNGDQTQRQVEVAPGQLVNDALPGSEIFMRIRTGDGTVDAGAAVGNTGSGLLTSVSRDGSDAWTGGALNVHFTAAGAGAYEVLDDAGAVVATGTHASGEDIVVGGVRLRIEGVPAAGDSFGVVASSSRDIFATLDTLVAALESDPQTAADRTGMQNLLQSSMRDITRASETMIDARAKGGAQLAAIDDAASAREATAVTVKSTLSTLRDLDYADAIGQYKLENAALQAAQTIFSQMQAMSLFNSIR
ncbi:flagellar hook-associated protein FlgL [Stenotrophomonas sp. CFBP 13718]|uniref:flagellar hook-associated protein FlgL n=1 Tax=Stenotrophomonas sp. CFBP 13718 TaxID=2775304 RepID=UPI00177F7C5A|nr:flagellar hook-associated protein FlgL [Stenotrophomonas sp. CFBP 13718]MBD8694719.1 flagellar hook-associated protein FlgL [Stenotrophomonas sp. CFBP 13718]